MERLIASAAVVVAIVGIILFSASVGGSDDSSGNAQTRDPTPPVVTNEPPPIEVTDTDLRIVGQVKDESDLSAGDDSHYDSCADIDEPLSVLDTSQSPLVMEEPQGLSVPSGLGAFTFDVWFDETKACVNLYPGEAVNAFICVAVDSSNSNLEEGHARINCVADNTLSETGIGEGPIVVIEAKPVQ